MRFLRCTSFVKSNMKKLSFFVFAFSVCFLFANSSSQSSAVFAQNADIDKVAARQADYKLAAMIKSLTNRSIDGLVQKRFPSGEFTLDTENRFQNVMLARIGADGDETSACVTSLAEANAFFGRNLETGDDYSYFQYQFQKDDAATVAARHGMSVEEFQFYKNLITAAEQGKLSSPSSATITIFNADGADEGFNDATAKAAEGGNNGATLGAQRLNLFTYAAGIWSAFLDSSVTITVNSNFDPLTCTSNSAILGSAGASGWTGNFPNAPVSNTYYPYALANKLRGSDSNGATAEINATFNSTVNNNAGCLGGERFYYGFDNTTPNGTVNLLVVVLHELGHGLGFQSLVNGTTGAMPNNLPDAFLLNMYDRSTGKYWSQMTDAERATSALNTGNVLWDGANVKIASGYLTAGRDAATGRVQLFTPNPFQQGSSISHYDTAASPNLLMEPVINTGLPIDLDLTRQEMRDIGWYRDTTADLVADTITGVTPNSGTANIGFSKTITWTNNGGFNRNVTIELSTDGGTTYPTVIASNVANTGSYSWTVPNTPTTQARVRVREFDFVAPLGASSANFVIASPTAAMVSVSGRVTDSMGRGISGARILATGNDGATIYAMTNSFGYFRYSEIASGETYVFRATHKRYTFAPQVVSLTEDLNGMNFVAQP